MTNRTPSPLTVGAVLADKQKRRPKKRLMFDLETIESMMEDYGGFCLDCGAEAYGVEPDARRYQCEACGARSVYGAEELIVMGHVH